MDDINSEHQQKTSIPKKVGKSLKATKAFKKTMAVLMISAASVTSTGCISIPKPFEQDVPQTTWIVDENGKKKKVTSGVSESVTPPQQVTNAANEFYASVFNDEKFEMFMKKDFEELSAKGAKIDANNPKELAAYKDELSKAVIKANPKFMTLISFENVNAKQKNEIVYEVFTTYALTFLFVSLAGEDAKILVEVPITSVKIKGTTAEIDLDEVKVTVTANKEKVTRGLNEDNTEKPPMEMVKLDGKWLVEGKSMLSPTETAKK